MSDTMQTTYPGNAGEGRFVSGMKFTLTLGVFLLIVLPAAQCAPAVDHESCDQVQRELRNRKNKLTEYISALETFQKKGDWTLAEIFSNEISDLILDIKRLLEVSGCPDASERKAPLGLSPVKTDVGPYATKSCTELKQTLVQLLIQTNALKRRERAILSPLNREEKAKLKKDLQELRQVRSVIGARCADSAPTRRRRR